MKIIKEIALQLLSGKREFPHTKEYVIALMEIWSNVSGISIFGTDENYEVTVGNPPFSFEQDCLHNIETLYLK